MKHYKFEVDPAKDGCYALLSKEEDAVMEFTYQGIAFCVKGKHMQTWEAKELAEYAAQKPYTGFDVRKASVDRINSLINRIDNLQRKIYRDDH